MIRTHGRSLVCTVCGAAEPVPSVGDSRSWDKLDVQVRRMIQEHAECKGLDPDYRLPGGTGVTDRRRGR